MCKISVVIPIYNVEKYLDRCIQSILNQTLRDIEIILVDDGSPDNCPKMCDEYAQIDSRIKVIHKKNEGLGHARNSGMKIATGEFITFVDSDDYIEKEAFEKIYARLKETGSECCIASYIDKKDSGKEIKKINPLGDVVYEEKDVLEIVLLGMMGAKPEYDRDTFVGMSAWKCVYLNKIVQEYFLEFPSEREYISEDIIFQLRIFPLLRKVCTSTYPYYYYCENGASMSLTKKYSADKFYRYEKLYLKELELLESVGQLEKGKYRAARMFLGNTRACIKQISRNKNLLTRDKKKMVWEITENETLRNIIEWYPWFKNPIKQRIMTFFLKYRKINFLIRFSKWRVKV